MIKFRFQKLIKHMEVSYITLLLMIKFDINIFLQINLLRRRKINLEFRWRAS